MPVKPELSAVYPTPRAVYIGSDSYKKSSFGQNHPLSYARQGSVLDLCRMLGWLEGDSFVQSSPASIKTLSRFHAPDYIEALRDADASGKVSKAVRERYNFGTMENPLFKGVFERASTTVGGSIQAANTALKKSIGPGVTAFHPAGGTHHGRRDKASGFCYFNDPVFAISTFLEAGLTRVLYLDIDAHHGDGVQAAFSGEPRVTCLSVHEQERWPYSGVADDQSDNCINVPVAQGINDSEYGFILERLILPFCQAWSPQAVVITCGADALAADPLSKMALSNGALWRVVEEVRAAVPSCVVPAFVVLGGGGYNPWTTVRCWVGLWGRLAGYELPQTLPPEATAVLSRFDSDLIDEEDRDPKWLTTLHDAPNTGSIRDEIKALVKTLIKRHLE